MQSNPVSVPGSVPPLPIPSDFESRCNASFEALMWALSRPGLPRDLPCAQAQDSHAAIVDALIDRECAVFCDDPDLAQHVSRTGAAQVSMDLADHLFLDRLDAADDLRPLRQGSDLHPEDGATMILRAKLGEGQAVRLSGPGVDGTLELRIAGLPDGFWRSRAQVMRYPTGFDLFLTDGVTVVGLPRSTAVEVL